MSRLTPWNPLREQALAPIRTWSDMMDRFFAPMAGDFGESTRWFPKSDFKETPESYEVTMDAPGLKPEEVEVAIEGDSLSIRGEHRQEERRQNDHWHFTERSYGAFERRFSLPSSVEPDSVDAGLKDGVLRVTVKKSKASQPRKIKVRGG